MSRATFSVTRADFCDIEGCDIGGCNVGGQPSKRAGGQRARGLWGGVLALLLCAACGQEDPEAPSVESYHPLVDGSAWDYEHNSWIEHVTLTATTYEGRAAFSLASSADPDDGIRSEAILADDGGRIVRLAKSDYQQGAEGDTLLSTITYGVGFTRFNEAWANETVGFQESPEYTRVETPAGGTPRTGEFRKHTFEVLSLSERVITPAGSFDCIKIRRTKDWQAEEGGTDAADAQTKTFWFARGVGRVKEQNDETGRIETLSAFDAPE
jgi:hypothetical protein